MLYKGRKITIYYINILSFIKFRKVHLFKIKIIKYELVFFKLI